MKQIIRASFLLLVLLAIAQPAIAAGPANSGHLIIKRSPAMGRNLSVTIRINGKLGGLLSWHRTFETDLTPGRHSISAEPSQFAQQWHGTVDVRPGQTYSYMAYYTLNRLVLKEVH
jgi:hypothetical protein